MEGISVDGSAAAIMAARERQKAKLAALIRGRRNDASFREGLRDGVQQYCAAMALYDLHLAQLKRDYARGTLEHMREVHRFLSSPQSEDELELRDMLNFVLGLLQCYVEMTEHQADMQATSALSNLDSQDLAHV